MDLGTFQSLPTEAVARLVRERGPKVCVFPINGTRRWFMLEHPDLAAADFVDAYLQIGGRRHVELYRMFFDHGVDTLLTPVFGPDLLERGAGYVQLAVRALQWFTQCPDFLDFYDACDVRVRVYGDARRYFQGTPYAHVLEAFAQVTQRTADHQRHRLFFGVCAHDAAETVAEIGARFYQEHARLPDKRQIVTAYYGEYVEPVDLFIGFADRLTVFDMPLIATGNESLYFTVSPSPYMDVATLRAILYDHLYTHRGDDAGYDALSAADWQAMSDFYTLNRRHVLGLGRPYTGGAWWYPLPQVELPQPWRRE